jgi:Ser/Thr protein kinase RdoA (MazF antagonist)
MNKMHESNHTKWNAILGDYDLAGPDCITELKPDTVWHIDHPSGQWVIAKRPIYDPGSRRVERLEAASRLMTELHRAGQLWVHAKRNKDGCYITVKDGSLYQVTSFDEGENTWNAETPEMLPDVGRAMGAYHRYQETSFDAQLPVHDFIEMTLNGLESRRQELLTFAAGRKPPLEAIDEAIERFRAITPALMTLPSGLIHMDLGTGNVLFKNGRLSAIIDFEAFFAPFILDIGITGLYWVIMPPDHETSDPRVDLGRLKTLLESYAEERSLGQDEILALKDAFVWCAIRKWSHGMGSNLHSRYDAYRCCLLDLDSDWLASCFA